jgi:hypothetical protein
MPIWLYFYSKLDSFHFENINQFLHAKFFIATCHRDRTLLSFRQKSWARDLSLSQSSIVRASTLWINSCSRFSACTLRRHYFCQFATLRFLQNAVMLEWFLYTCWWYCASFRQIHKALSRMKKRKSCLLLIGILRFWFACNLILLGISRNTSTRKALNLSR